MIFTKKFLNARHRLTDTQRRVIRAIAEALFFDGEQAPPMHRLDWLEDDVDDYFSSISSTTQVGLSFGLFVIQHSPLFVSARLRRLTQLPVGDRVAYLEHLESSRVMPITMLFYLVKVMISAVYFEHPEALRETGFDGQAMIGERLDHPLAPLAY